MSAMARPLSRAGRMPPGALQAVFVPFVASRVIVAAALVLTRHVVTTLHVHAPIQTRQGLLAWDAAFYRDIASHGYLGQTPALRFFPLLPVLARPLMWVPGVDAGAAVVIVANVSAFAVGFVLYRLAWHERHDEDLARRAVWLVYLVPPAFVLVLGYAEALLMVWAILALIALRSGRWWLAALAGVLAGLTRPVGVLLVVPALVEVLRDRRHVGRREWIARARPCWGRSPASPSTSCGSAPASATASTRCASSRTASRRGGWTDPGRALYHAARDFESGDHVSSGLHLFTALLLLVLLIVLARRWPLSFTLYARPRSSLGLSSRNLDSLERYSLSAVPFVLAAADVIDSPTRERVVLVLLGAGLAAFSVLAFTGALVP